MRKNVHPLERGESMLKTKPNRPQYGSKGKYGKKGACAIKQAPICMLAGEVRLSGLALRLRHRVLPPPPCSTAVRVQSNAHGSRDGVCCVQPYDDPRDFTLDLKTADPTHNVSAVPGGAKLSADFEITAGRSVMKSLMPSLPITRPLRGEFSLSVQQLLTSITLVCLTARLRVPRSQARCWVRKGRSLGAGSWAWGVTLNRSAKRSAHNSCLVAKRQPLSSQ